MDLSNLELLYGNDPARSNQFNTNFDHIETDKFKSQQVKFWGSDSEQLKNKNLVQFKPGHPWRKWEHADISYTVNRQNYRCPEWHNIDWDDSILVFGCSNIFGIGLDDRDTVSECVSSHLHVPVINLGVPGSSVMFTWINSTKLREAGIAPRAVVYVWTYPERVTVLGDNNKVINSGQWNAVREPLAKGWLYHPTHGLEYLKYTIQSCRQQWQCNTYHYTLCEETAKKIDGVEFLPQIDYSRDRQHIGIETAKHWAGIISSNIAND